MKKKGYNIYILMIIVILAFGIITLSGNILNTKNKEVKVAKEFIELLIDKDIIDENSEKMLEEKHLNQSIGKSSNIQYSVILGSYAIDIDKDFKVIGFSNKNLDVKDRIINISEEEAILLAKKYLKEITDSEVLFKEVKEKDEENNSHYSVVFYKSKDGYPIYRQEIIMVIDKYSGKLDSYSNNNSNITTYNKVINFNESEIKAKMEKYFSEIKKDISYISDGMLAYVNVNGEYNLAYIFNIISEPTEEIIVNNENYEKPYDGKEENKELDKELNKEEIVIVRTDNGEFINLDTSLINK